MAKRKTKTTLPEVTVESIIASKIAELEQRSRRTSKNQM